ncbi:Uncharacterized ABC transporter ATP-binding protein HI_1252 [Aedoeadaptatus ivorii]|uniref:Uncharacterized ABC transporter ATP-binding protein HI_1252 n=1 Tax=Aedoeadaptatus ivorii TaxID=54006 RepID=A0A3S4Y844_9FIRM|nr:ABC-F family ATP-binding cassette domain-containing protein [Peptoniphilus ivorii]VEJ36226.1 Uncharacterized ABC transporter ATP-binding protein HI_1252 [Peptoniphilus ivorii]
MIRIDHLVKTIGTQTILQIDHLTIDENRRIGLIGDNGAGKTTFLKLLAGRDDDFAGEIQATLPVLYMPAVGKGDGSRTNTRDPRSPGQRQRARLEEFLAQNDTFLLIDEPTSHLDIRQIQALEESLCRREGGYMVVSHDRDFIERTCDCIFELDDTTVEVYNGGYRFYVEERERRKKFAQREYNNYVKEKKRLLGVGDRLKKQSGRVRSTPKRMGNSEARLHKMGGQGNKKKLDRQVKSVQSRIEHLEKKEKPKEAAEIRLSAPASEKIHSKILIRAEHLNKQFEDCVLFQDAEFTIENGTKAALLGDNGAGKTTLVSMILRGEGIWVHPKLKIGYYSQMGEILTEEESILDNVVPTSIYDESMTRIVLARLGLEGADVHKTVERLSDGEQAKTKLAKLMTSEFHFLILDEPTNFLDIATIEALEQLLIAYDRPLLMITHDVSFIDAVADALLLIEDRKIRAFQGNFSDYRHRSDRKASEDEERMRIDFRLSAINAALSSNPPKGEREELEREFQELLQRKRERS